MAHMLNENYRRHIPVYRGMPGQIHGEFPVGVQAQNGANDYPLGNDEDEIFYWSGSQRPARSRRAGNSSTRSSSRSSSSSVRGNRHGRSSRGKSSSARTHRSSRSVARRGHGRSASRNGQGVRGRSASHSSKSARSSRSSHASRHGRSSRSVGYRSARGRGGSTPAQRAARLQNIKKAQAARRNRGLGWWFE